MAGEIIYHAGSTPPTGALVANGALVSRTAYAALFAAIGTTYGAGDGSTTFALPDLRGEFLRGLDSGRGVNAGRLLGSAEVATVISEAPYSAGSGGVTSNGVAGVDPAYDTVNMYRGIAGATRVTLDRYPVRPRNIALLPCIIYQ